MNITIFSHGSGRYGAELALVEMVAILAKDHSVHVVLPNRGPLEEELSSLGVSHEVLPFRWWIHNPRERILKIIARFLLSLLLAPFIAFKIKKNKPDVIFTNTIAINVGALVAILLRRPHVWFVQEFVEEDHGMKFDLGRSFSLRCVNRLSDVVVVVSRTLFEKYKTSIDQTKLRLIYYQNIKKPNLSEKPSWPSLNSANLLKLVMVGGISVSKGQSVAIEALHLLKESGIKDIELVILGIGSSEYMAMLRQAVSTYQINEQVFFLGYVDNPYPIIRGSDALLMLSRFEALGRVTIEAMFCGKVVIGSNSAGTLELIEDNVTGLLYDVGSAESLSQRIFELYKKRGEIDIIGRNAREFVSKFHDPDTYRTTLNRLLDEVK